MKKLLLFKLCLTLLSLAVLSSCATFQRSKPIIIPFTIENGDIVIYAEVNGVTGKYLWDTGCFDVQTFIPLENLTPLPANRNPTPSLRYYIENGIVIDSQVISSRSIINYIPSHNHPQWEWLAPYLTDNGFDGILGIAIFNGWWVEVSFSTNNIILHKHKPRDYTDFYPARTTFRGLYDWMGGFYVAGTIDGIPIDFLLDTGAQSAFTFPHSLRENFSDVRKILTLDDFYYEFQVGNISLMGEVFNDKTITTDSVAEYFSTALLGMEFLQHYDLLFDLRNLRTVMGGSTRLYFKRLMEVSDTEQSFVGITSPRYDPFGVGVYLNENGFLIVRVTIPGFAHDELGLLPGMTLTNFNGRDLGGLEIMELSRILRHLRDGGTGELTIIDPDGTERVIVR